jgi:hypothetical protein
MYVNPFFFGVASTIFAEIVIIFIVAIITAIRRVKR